MHRAFVLALVLVFVGMAPGWQVYLLAEDACGPQADLKSSVPIELQEPNGLDTALFQACAILPPVRTDTLPADANSIPWHAPLGKMNRVAPYCVDKGYRLVKIECLSAGSSTPGTVTVDPNALTWTLAVSVMKGPNWWLVHAVEEHMDDPSVIKENSVLVMVYGDEPQVAGVRLF